MQQEAGSKCVTRSSLSKLVSGSLLVAGTAVGAGMLGIPLATGAAGFTPAFMVTVLAWLFMLATGLLFMEVTLWMPEGANLISMSHRFLGSTGKWFSGFMFLFLYYCLVVAYIAGGAPLFQIFVENTLSLPMSSLQSYLLFTLIIGGIVALGPKSIDRANIILSIGMAITFGLLIAPGMSVIDQANFESNNYSLMVFAIPVLFSAFGYHNVIPSLCTYLEKDRKAVTLSIVVGTVFALIVYLMWQYLILGAVPLSTIEQTLAEGKTSVEALQGVTGGSSLLLIARFFAAFAILTSLLGVSFSMVDFYADGLKLFNYSLSRVRITALVFVPALLCTIYNPKIFDQALGLAGGVGEAILNGMIPVMLVWMGRYVYHIKAPYQANMGKATLLALFLAGLFVVLLEGYVLFK